MPHRFCAITLSMLCLLFVPWSLTTQAQTCTDGKYTVTTAAQLQNALDCIADDCAGSCLTCSGGCPNEIIIPAGTTIEVTSTTYINQNHPGVTLTINGTLKSVGAFFGTILDLLDSTNVTVRGSGLITTDDTHTGGVISTAIRIADCTNVTVEGLDFLNVGSMILANFERSNGITLSNLDGVNMRNYGMWIGGAGLPNFDQNVMISNCTVNGVTNDHGFRVYGYGVEITDCEAYDCPSGHGLWMVEGSDVTIDGFTSDELIRIGPNHTGPDLGERLRCVVARNITGTLHPTGECIRIGLGTQGLYMENITATGTVTIHDRPSDGIPRPTDRIHWRNVTADAVSVDVDSYLCPDYGPCLGDVDNDGVVDVDDLLGVVNAWGACPTPIPSSSECYQCVADIEPFNCGNATVNVDDLLTVINDWGCTFSTEGDAENAPQSLADCEDICETKAGGYGTPAWWACYDDCANALCKAGFIECE